MGVLLTSEVMSQPCSIHRQVIHFSGRMMRDQLLVSGVPQRMALADSNRASHDEFMRRSNEAGFAGSYHRVINGASEIWLTNGNKVIYYVTADRQYEND